ncbi:hypothetical protein CY34DRAFT_495827 [Suillus luteus UH-Slu-Lm8-n1]|uniref:Uncharacterized protein n=1 Tax=Suillus luteus UH-Slu-Lm8-n1 TaxID=930992 RepID=A0A0D0B7E5_9AGAM|nr:hypothetical protein CY34DRAFT_495827 [Suillus luteus UH-Slu-Lm8-n1]
MIKVPLSAISPSERVFKCILRADIGFYQRLLLRMVVTIHWPLGQPKPLSKNLQLIWTHSSSWTRFHLSPFALSRCMLPCIFFDESHLQTASKMLSLMAVKMRTSDPSPTLGSSIKSEGLMAETHCFATS